MKSKNLFSKTNLVGVVCFILFITNCVQAQWRQMGPGAGGQEKALFLYENNGGDFELFVGSDVSGVWRSDPIDQADLNDPNQYNYHFISNHEIMRFVNVFYRPIGSDVLLVGNRSGIDRVNLLNQTMTMTTVSSSLALDDSWVSAIHTSQLNVFTSTHNIYFVTGNTRVSDNSGSNHKNTAIRQDLYYGKIDPAFTNMTNLVGIDLAFATTAPDQDIFCMAVMNGANVDEIDDEILMGTEDGLWRVTRVALNSCTGPCTLSTANRIAPHSAMSSQYKVTSIEPSTVAGWYFVTVHGHGVYNFNPSTNVFIPLFTGFQSRQFACGFQNNLQPLFSPTCTRMLPVLDNGTPFGFILVNEEATWDTLNTKYYCGLMYCNSVNVGGSWLPDQNWEAFRVCNPNNEWGWNTTRPCANNNGIIMGPDNRLYVGKQGNIFTTIDSIHHNGLQFNIFQQIYTHNQADAICTNELEYEHQGYVNTANKTVFPQSSQEIYLGQADRLIWHSTDGGNFFEEIEAATVPTNCALQVDISNMSFACNPTENFSDCFFITNNNADKSDPYIYAGIGAGEAQNQGTGVIFRKHKSKEDLTFERVGNTVCGDPIKMIFTDDGEKYAIFNLPGPPRTKRLFYLNNGNWTQVVLSTIGNYQVIDAQIAPDGNQLFIILDNTMDQNSFVAHTGAQLSWSHNCTLQLNNTLPLFGQVLNMIKYNDGAPQFRIICGAAPTSTAPNNCLLEVFNSANPCALPIVIPALGNFTIFNNLHFDPIDEIDQGVTAIEVNEDLHTIYVATVHDNNTLTPPVRSHIYSSPYDVTTGQISGVWTAIGDPTLPNKTVVGLSSHGSDRCNSYLFACMRGLGPWRIDNLPVPTQSMLTSANFSLGFVGTGEYTLNGSITINNDVQVNGANIQIAPGKSIRVTTGNTLTITKNSHLFACNNMWQGLIIEPGAELIVNGNSVIKDAEFGTIFLDGAIGDINQATYDHCYVGIDLNDFNTGILNVNNTDFSCKDCLDGKPLLQPYSGQTTTLDELTFAGIRAQYSTINIGTIANSRNNFYDLHHGINLYNSIATVKLSRFRNLSATWHYGMFSGIGIFADFFEGGELHQTGLGLDPENLVTFDSCFIGIETNGTGNVFVTQNKMQSMGIGVLAQSNADGVIGISNNKMVGDFAGVFLIDNDFCNNIDVSDNHITHTGDISFGIVVFESSFGAKVRQCKLNCNHIIAENGVDGILLNDVISADLQQNNVELVNIQKHMTGINCVASDYSTFIENTVTGDIDWHTAILVSMSVNTEFTNNHVDNTAYGFQFWNNCANTKFRGNEINNHMEGLWLNSSAVIGLQPSGNPALNNGNKWLRYNNPFYSFWIGAVNNNLAPGVGGWAGSLFFTHISSNTPPQQFHPKYTAPGAWFQFFPGAPFSGTFPNACNIAIDNAGEGEQESMMRLDTLIVEDSISALDYDPELQYNTKRYVYAKVAADGGLNSDNGMLEVFYDSVTTTSVPVFEAIESLLADTGNYRASVTNYLSEIRQLHATSFYYDSLYADLPSIGLLQQKAVVGNQLKNYRVALDSILQLSHNEKDNKNAAAKLLNDAVLPYNDIETTEQTINDIALTYGDLAGAIVPQGVKTTVANIASLCPFAYGTSVYRDRTQLVKWGYSPAYYDDKSKCELLGYYRQASMPLLQIESQAIIINPNITNGDVLLSIKIPSAAGDKIYISDVIGNIVLEVTPQVNSTGLQINLSQLANGMYNVTLRSEYQSINAKLTIVK